MSLTLMYVTNRPDVALAAEAAGVDRIFVDMEFIGKRARQGGLDTVQYHHTVEDVHAVREVLTRAELMVRVNPIHDAGSEDGFVFDNSEEEIEAVIRAGADVIMLPYFKTTEELRRFVSDVDGRAVTFPLLETPEAVSVLDEILEIPGIDQIHIGLNDLSLGMRSGFMFGLLCDGTVDAIAGKCREKGMPFGFGGIASIGKGALPAEYIIGEHYRLGSGFTILARSFCNTQLIPDIREIARIFDEGVPKIRTLEQQLTEELARGNAAFFEENHRKVAECVRVIQEQMDRRPN